jgi:tetratricopeptide (TPR) repeat protein
MAHTHTHQGGWTGKVDCLNHLASAQASLADSSALQTFQLALGIWREKGNRAGESAILMQLAQTNVLFNDYGSAVENLEQSLELRRSLNDKRGQADCLMKFVYVFGSMRNFGRAHKAYEECMGLRLELKDEAAITEMLNVKGLLLMQEGRVDDSLNTYNEALKMRRKAQHMEGIADTLNNMAVCFNFKGDHVNAVAHFRECLNIIVQERNVAKQSQVRLCLCVCM